MLFSTPCEGETHLEIICKRLFFMCLSLFHCRTADGWDKTDFKRTTKVNKNEKKKGSCVGARGKHISPWLKGLRGLNNMNSTAIR